jgi:hypothetical protein
VSPSVDEAFYVASFRFGSAMADRAILVTSEGLGTGNTWPRRGLILNANIIVIRPTNRLSQTADVPVDRGDAV